MSLLSMRCFFSSCSRIMGQIGHQWCRLRFSALLALALHLICWKAKPSSAPEKNHSTPFIFSIVQRFTELLGSEIASSFYVKWPQVKTTDIFHGSFLLTAIHFLLAKRLNHLKRPSNAPICRNFRCYCDLYQCLEENYAESLLSQLETRLCKNRCSASLLDTPPLISFRRKQ